MWKKRLFIGLALLAVIVLVPYSIPIVFALVTAFVLEGAIRRLQQRLNLKRLYAVLIVFLSYLASLIAVAAFMINTIFKQLVTLSQNAPGFVQELYGTTILPIIDKWRHYSETLPNGVIFSIERTLENSVNSLDMLAKNIAQGLISFVAVIPAFMLEFLVYFIALFLISLELPLLKEKASAYLTKETKEKLYLIANQLGNAGIGFLVAQIVLSLLTFIMAYTGLWLLNISYTALLALLIVIVDILPILGTGSVLVPWAVIAIMQDNQSLGIGLLILFAVITVVRRIVEPKIYSTSMGISPLAAIISMYIGFKLLGFAGLFLGPTLIIIYDALKKSGIIQMKFKI